MQARREALQVAVVREHPVAAPQLAHERVRVLERDAALRRLADVGDDVLAADRVAPHHLGDRRRRARSARRRTGARPCPRRRRCRSRPCAPRRASRSPVKLNITSVGVLAFMPRSWHMAAAEDGAADRLQYGRRPDALVGLAQEKAAHRRVGAEADGALARDRARSPHRRSPRRGGRALPSTAGSERTSFGSSAASAARPAAAPCASRRARTRGSRSRADRRPERDERVVELDDRAPRDGSRRDGAGVCADWIAASSWNAPGAPSAAALASAASPTASSSRVPARRVLRRERHVVAGGVAPRRRARLAEGDQRQQPPGFGRVGQQASSASRASVERLVPPSPRICASVPATSSQPVPYAA